MDIRDRGRDGRAGPHTESISKQSDQKSELSTDEMDGKCNLASQSLYLYLSLSICLHSFSMILSNTRQLILTDSISATDTYHDSTYIPVFI